MSVVCTFFWKYEEVQAAGQESRGEDRLLFSFN